jgi:hypothetical protein
MSATIYITAPEVYTVVLSKELNEDSPVTSKTPWTSGFTITDQNGRVIPIDAATGQIKVVFGYEYTIVGVNSTSNYKFMSPNNDLTDLTKVNKTAGTFTMIRDNLTPATPVVLYITEGLATELTVYLTDTDKNYAVGDVFCTTPWRMTTEIQSETEYLSFYRSTIKTRRSESSKTSTATINSSSSLSMSCSTNPLLWLTSQRGRTSSSLPK